MTTNKSDPAAVPVPVERPGGWRAVTETDPPVGDWVRGRWDIGREFDVQRGPAGWQFWGPNGLALVPPPDGWMPTQERWATSEAVNPLNGTVQIGLLVTEEEGDAEIATAEEDRDIIHKGDHLIVTRREPDGRVKVVLRKGPPMISVWPTFRVRKTGDTWRNPDRPGKPPESASIPVERGGPGVQDLAAEWARETPERIDPAEWVAGFDDWPAERRSGFVNGLSAAFLDCARALKERLDTATPHPAAVEQGVGTVEYRPGLPGVEQVKAHEERGGWWQAQRPKGLQMLRLAVRRWGEVEAVCASTSDATFGPQEPEYFSKSSLRPASPEGDPMPWPGEPTKREADRVEGVLALADEAERRIREVIEAARIEAALAQSDLTDDYWPGADVLPLCATVRALTREIDRLRAVIESAPHPGYCPADPPACGPCACWKATALKGGGL